MKSIVIDANVFGAFALEHLSEKVSEERTASPLRLFNSLGNQTVAFLDNGGQIEQEWRNLALFASEWFGEWLADAYSEGRIFEVDPSNDPQLLRRYRALGFPNTKDIWYIKTAHGLCRMCQRNRPLLIAEDIDFYDPKKKNEKNKKEFFKAGKGAVSQLLRSDGIDLMCIENANKEIFGTD